MIKNQWGNEENTKLDPPGRVFLNLCITLPLGSQTNAAVEPNRSTEPNPQPTTLLLVHPPYFSPYFPPILLRCGFRAARPTRSDSHGD